MTEQIATKLEYKNFSNFIILQYCNYSIFTLSIQRYVLVGMILFH